MAQGTMMRGIGLLIAIAALLASAAPAAEGATPNCGAVIKKDIRFNKNLNCTNSNSDGLNIGKSGIEIDLNGKKLIGLADSYYGIETDGYDGIKIKNGTIKGFDYGLYAYYSSQLKVQNVDFNMKGDNSDYGLYVNYAHGATIKDVTVDNGYYGAYLYEINGLIVDKLIVTGSDENNTYGINGTDLTGKINKLRANGAYYGLYAGGYATPLKITNSTANNAGYAGFYISNSTPFSDYRYILLNNTANNSGEYGFYASSYDTAGGGNKAKGAGTQNCYNVPCF